MAAEPVDVSTPKFTGTALLDGGNNRLTWSAWFDVTTAQATSQLTNWAKADVLVDGALSARVVRQTANGATFEVVRETPVFLPNITMVFAAVVDKHSDGSVVIRWTQEKGPASSMVRTWRLRPHAGGVFVEHTLHIQMPFSPPSFMLGDPVAKLHRNVDVTRRVVRAKHMLRSPPVVNTPAEPQP